MNDLLNWRSEFPILERTTYLISNSLGAMPRGVYERLRDYSDTWATRGVRAWEDGRWEMAVAVGDKVGALIGADSGEISLHQNVTLTQASIASCFDFSAPRNKVVLLDLEFPSIIYFYLRLSPHFYNRDEEIDFALSQIEEILATGAWKQHLQVAAKATCA